MRSTPFGPWATSPRILSRAPTPGEIVPVEPGEAEWLLDVLEGLFDFCFVQPAALAAKQAALDKKLTDPRPLGALPPPLDRGASPRGLPLNDGADAHSVMRVAAELSWLTRDRRISIGRRLIGMCEDAKDRNAHDFAYYLRASRTAFHFVVTDAPRSERVQYLQARGSSS